MSKYLVVYNPGSGGASDLDELKATFKSNGLEPDFVSIKSDFATKVQALAGDKDATIVAAGGDGTVGAVAAIVAGGKASFGVIPCGTLNHFAKDLGLPSDLNEAIEVIKLGLTMPIDAATVNERIFINNSSIGIYSELVRSRDRHKDTFGKWLAAVGAIPAVLMRRRNYTVTLEIDGQTVTRTTPFIFVGNNSYGITNFGLTNRTCLDNGELCLYLLKACTVWGIFIVSMRILLGLVDSASTFESYAVRKLKVELDRQTIDVAFDGEVKAMKTPLCYASMPKSLRVIVPKKLTTHQ